MEMKFYEKIGVRQWKKLILWMFSKICRNPEYRKGAFNYYLWDLSIKSVKKFKFSLLFNGIIHGSFVVFQCYDFIAGNNKVSFSNFILFLLNLYCLMLQRYDWLRIKKVLKKVTRN